MSRCFPFPPPGYEKRLRNSEQESLLSKEKHKEKKRKKEKKDKERVENKERNDNGSRDKHNDGNRDKHKEKKDKKEKHKDKKRKKEDDKNESTLHTNSESHMANEIKDSKFAEPGRRIRTEEQGATNLLAKNISDATSRRIGNNAAVASSTVGKEKFTTNNTATTGSVLVRTKIDNPISPFHHGKEDGPEIRSAISEKQKTANKYNIQEFTSLEKRNGKHAAPFLYKRTEGVEAPANIEKQIAGGNEKRFTPPNDKHTPLFQNRRTEGIETPSGIEKQKLRFSEKNLTPPPMVKKFDEIKERSKVQINQKADSCDTEDRRNRAITRPFDESPSQKGDNTYAVHSNQKLRNSNVVSNANGFSTKSNNALDRLVESITSIPESIGCAEATENEKRTFPNTNQSGSENKITKHKLEDAKTDGRHKDRDGKEKNKKEKDRDRRKKKEEKKKMKIEKQHTNHGKSRDSETTGQVNGLNSKSLAAPHLVKLNASSADGNSMKRKQFEMNGLLHEPQLVEQPNKLPRIDASSPHQISKNGNNSESSRGAIKLGNTNNFTIKRGMENNGASTNDKAKIELQPPPIPKPPMMHIAPDLKKNNVAAENNDNSTNSKAKIELQPPPISKPPMMLIAPDLKKNNVAAENNGNSTNCKAKIELQPPPIPKPPMMHSPPDLKKTNVAAESSKKELIRTRPPHRDTKYLDMIYSLPKLEGIPESDEQDWLFSNMENAAKAKFEANKSPPQVWAQGLRIDEADIFALPYVVPF